MYRKTKAATRIVSRGTIEGNFGAAAWGIGARPGAARHLPSARTARGANKASAIAPWTKMARIIPGGNLLERKAMESSWLATVEMPYMPTKRALASIQPCQRDLRMR